MDGSMRRILTDDDSGQDARDGDAAGPPLYVRSHAHVTSVPPAAMLAGAHTETATPPLPPTMPVSSSTPSRRRTNSASSTGASHYSASSNSSASHRLKGSYHRSSHAASSSSATGGNSSTSASPHVALELPSTPSSIAAALGNASVADTTPSDATAGDNSRNTATMLSDSASEHEIAEFGRILDDMLARVTHRELVKKTAEYMKAHPQHSMRFQIKIKQVQCVSV